MKRFFKLFLSFCISIMVTGCANNTSKETIYIESINDQQDLKITLKEEISFVLTVYKLNLKKKQWEEMLLTNENLKWKKEANVILYNPINDDGLCLKINNKNGVSEKYAYDNIYYDSVISNESNFVWLLNANIDLIENKEIPIAYGIFLNDDNKMTLDFDVSLMNNTSKIENNMIMFTIKVK